MSTLGGHIDLRWPESAICRFERLSTDLSGPCLVVLCQPEGFSFGPSAGSGGLGRHCVRFRGLCVGLRGPSVGLRSVS